MRKILMFAILAVIVALAGCSRGVDQLGAKQVSQMLDNNPNLNGLLKTLGAQDSISSLKEFFGVPQEGNLLEVAAKMEQFTSFDTQVRVPINNLVLLNPESIKKVVHNSEDMDQLIRGSYYALGRVKSFSEFELETHDNLVEVLYLLGEFQSVEEADRFAIRIGVEKDIDGVKKDLLNMKNSSNKEFDFETSIKESLCESSVPLGITSQNPNSKVCYNGIYELEFDIENKGSAYVKSISWTIKFNEEELTDSLPGSGIPSGRKVALKIPLDYDTVGDADIDSLTLVPHVIQIGRNETCLGDAVEINWILAC